VAFWVFGAPAVWAALAFVLASPVKLATHLVGLRDKLHYYRLSIPYWRSVVGPAGRWVLEFCVLLAAVTLACLALVSLLLRAEGPVFVPPPPGVIVFLTAVGYFVARGLWSWLRLRGRPDKSLMQKLYLLAYPVVVGVLIARFRDIVQDSYATELKETGLFSALKIAKNLGDVPTAIVPVALSMAMFPFLCDLFTKQNLAALSETVARALKMIVLVVLPFTAVVVILRLPVMQLVSSKQVDAQLIDATSLALALYALGFVFYAVEAVLMQTFFSLQNTWVPALVGGIASLGQVWFLYLAFHKPEGGETSAAAAWLAGIGLTPFMIIGIAFPLSRAVKNVVLAGVLHAKVKLFHVRDVAAFVPQVLIVTGATALLTWAAWLAVGGVKIAGIVGKAVRLGVPCTAALAGFLGALFLLKWIGWPVAEFDIILRWLHETGWQKIKARVRGRK
jgi:peptidoglycan biosynthesis protein MviN/MurJ (putative lipid II flippase)